MYCQACSKCGKNLINKSYGFIGTSNFRDFDLPLKFEFCEECFPSIANFLNKKIKQE